MSRSWRMKKSRPSGAPGPAEEHVAGGLHQPVAVHNALAVVGENARARVRLQHRGAGLLHLEEERIVLAGHEEEDEAGGPDAADPNHFDGGVPKFVAVEQGLEGMREGGAISVERVQHDLMDLPGGMALGVEDGGELVLDDGHLPLVFDKLGEDLLGGALRPFLLDALDDPLAEVRGLGWSQSSPPPKARSTRAPASSSG